MTSEYYLFLLRLPDSLHLLRLLRFTGVEYCSGQSKSLSVWELFLALRRQGCKIEYRCLWQVSFVEKIPPFRTDNTIAVQSLLNIGNVWWVLFFSSVPVKVEFKSLMVGFWIMSVFIRILAFTGRLSDLIQSDRFLIELLAYGQKGLLFVHVLMRPWNKMDAGLVWCLSKSSSYLCSGPFLSSKQSCPHFTHMFSRLEFGHQFCVTFEEPDSTDREHGGYCVVSDRWTEKWGHRELQCALEANACPSPQPSLCLMLSSWK